MEINISFVLFAFWSSSFLCNLGYLKSSTISNRCVLRRQGPVFAPKSSQTGGGFRSTRRWRGGGEGGCGGLSSRPYEKRESRARKNFSRPRGLQFGLIEVQSSKFIERFCKVFKDTGNNTRGTREGTRTTQASSLVPPMRKNIAKTEKKRNTFVCGVWNRLNTCDAGSFL